MRTRRARPRRTRASPGPPAGNASAWCSPISQRKRAIRCRACSRRWSRCCSAFCCSPPFPAESRARRTRKRRCSLPIRSCSTQEAFPPAISERSATGWTVTRTKKRSPCSAVTPSHRAFTAAIPPPPGRKRSTARRTTRSGRSSRKGRTCGRCAIRSLPAAGRSGTMRRRCCSTRAVRWTRAASARLALTRKQTPTSAIPSFCVFRSVCCCRRTSTSKMWTAPGAIWAEIRRISPRRSLLRSG